MAKFQLSETIHSERVDTVRLGNLGVANQYSDTEVGKFVKLADDSRYVLAAVGDPIEAIVTSTEQGTVDGYTLGGVVRRGMKEVILDGVQATPGTGIVAVNDLVVVGTVVAKDTRLNQGTFKASPKVCKATSQAPGLHNWRVEALLDGSGAVGKRAIIVRI